MPIIIPPLFLDMPAIIRTATHAPSNPALGQRRLALPPTGARPNGVVETPGIVVQNPSPSPSSHSSETAKGAQPGNSNGSRN
jgi:hypothetical protein